MGRSEVTPGRACRPSVETLGPHSFAEAGRILSDPPGRANPASSVPSRTQPTARSGPRPPLLSAGPIPIVRGMTLRIGRMNKLC